MKERRFPRLSPTGILAALLFVLASMWYAASSQNNAAAYLLFFALTAVVLLSIPQTLLNLSGLQARAESVKPSFAGDEIALPVEIMNASRAARTGVALSLPGFAAAVERVDEIRGGAAERVMLRFSAPSRGEHVVPELCLATVYPLGFVRASKRVPCGQRFLVYPRPAGDPKLPVRGATTTESHRPPDVSEGDDFAGVRAYVPGESQRHIDWKAVARGQALMTKQFTAESDGQLYLDLADTGGDDLEARLSQLALWIVEAERARRPYGLRLASVEIRPALGEAHFHRCLRALSLY